MIHQGIPMPLNPRKRRFVEEYLIDLDAKHAAIRAGYSRRSKSYPPRLMREPAILEAIGKAMAARAERTGITRQRVLEEYARLAFADLRALADWGPDGAAIKQADALSDEAAAAIAFVGEATMHGATNLRAKTFDKMKALEALARLLDPRRRAEDGKALPPRAALHE
jgi:phage terminase small subunit